MFLFWFVHWLWEWRRAKKLQNQDVPVDTEPLAGELMPDLSINFLDTDSLETELEYVSLLIDDALDRRDFTNLGSLREKQHTFQTKLDALRFDAQVSKVIDNG